MSFFSEESEEPGSDDRLPSDFEVEEINSDPESIAYGIYSILSGYKDHFQKLQNKLKSLTVTWVIATFIGIGYVISGYEKALDINIYIIILFLSLLASLGVFLLWFLDVAVYYKLLKSIWLEVYALEEKFSVIGESYHNMAKLLAVDKAPQKFHGYFYIYFIIFFIFISFVCLGLYLYYINPFLSLLLLPIAILIIFLLYFAFKHTVYKDESLS